jgi:hypothetical protein
MRGREPEDQQVRRVSDIASTGWRSRPTGSRSMIGSFGTSFQAVRKANTKKGSTFASDFLDRSRSGTDSAVARCVNGLSCSNSQA